MGKDWGVSKGGRESSGIWQVTARGSSGLRGPRGRMNVSLSTTGLRHARLYLLQPAMGLVLGSAQGSALPPPGLGRDP